MDEGPRPEVVFPAALGSFFVVSVCMCICCGYLQQRLRNKQIQQMNQTCNQHAQYMACQNAYPYQQPPLMQNTTRPQLHLPPQTIPGRVISPYNQQMPPSAPTMNPGYGNLQGLPNNPPPKYEELPPGPGFDLPAQKLQPPPYPINDRY